MRRKKEVEERKREERLREADGEERAHTKKMIGNLAHLPFSLAYPLLIRCNIFILPVYRWKTLPG